MMMNFETCQNCGRAIGRLETPCIWKENVVCESCYKCLSASTQFSMRHLAIAGLSLLGAAVVVIIAVFILSTASPHPTSPSASPVVIVHESDLAGNVPPLPTSGSIVKSSPKLSASQLNDSSTTVNIGGKVITIPAPKGYVRVVPAMQRASEEVKAAAPPDNIVYAFYIEEREADAALAGKSGPWGRTCSVQVPKGSVNKTCTPEFFFNLKNLMRDQQIDEELLRSRQEISRYVEDSSKKVMDKRGFSGVVVKLGGMLALAPHDESGRTIAASIYSRASWNTGDSDSTPFIVVTTGTIVRVKDRMMLLYCSGDEDELEWTRKNAKAWTKDFLEANPD